MLLDAASLREARTPAGARRRTARPRTGGGRLMPDLLSPSGQAALRRLGTRHSLLAFDLDGTLAPLRALPG